MTARLRGHTALVALDSERSVVLARRLVDEGAQVVVVGSDGRHDGELAAAMDQDGSGPAAVFCLETGADSELDALVELVAELSRRSLPGPRPDGPEEMP